MIEHLYGRRVVVMREEGKPPRKVALPIKWSDKRRKDYQDFDSLSAAEKRHILLCITSFPYFLHHVYLREFCPGEGKPWPEKLWSHLRILAEEYQAALPAALKPFEVFEGESDPVWRRCYVAPNRTLKSTVTSAAFPLWLIGINPTFMRIILVTATQDLAQMHLRAVRDFIVESDHYKEIFGELRAPKSKQPWAADAFKVDLLQRVKDYSMSVFGWTGGVEGAGCDVAIIDDVQNVGNSESALMRARQWGYVQEALEKRLDPHNRLEIVIQTRHAVDDFAGMIQEENKRTGAWAYRELPAISGKWPPTDDDWIDPALPPAQKWRVENLKDPDEWRSRLLCEDVLPLQALFDDYLPETGREAFYRCRLNKVQDPENKWFPRTLLEDNCRADGGLKVNGDVRPQLTCWDVEFGRPEPGDPLYGDYAAQGVFIKFLVLSIDTAATAPKPGYDPDYTVFELWGMSDRNVRVLLDLVRFRTDSPKEFRYRLKRWIDAYRPEFVIMETNGMALWVSQDAKAELGVPIINYSRGADADIQIKKFKDLIESGLLLYCWGDGRSKMKMSQFEEELVLYGEGGAHDDTLVAAVQAQMRLIPDSSAGVRAFTAADVETTKSSENEVESLLSDIREKLERLEGDLVGN